MTHIITIITLLLTLTLTSSLATPPHNTYHITNAQAAVIMKKVEGMSCVALFNKRALCFIGSDTDYECDLVREIHKAYVHTGTCSNDPLDNM